MRIKLLNQFLKESYRTDDKAFTRNRKLTFPTLVGLILQKSTKPIQIKLNEFFEFSKEESVTASAYTQARANLSHRIFIDLNKDGFADAFYSVEDYETYKGHRLLAIDGSKIRLPDNKRVREEFGTIRFKNQNTEGHYTGGLCSVFYDVLNENAVDGILSSGNDNEIRLAKEHLKFCNKNDLILLDRNYPGYELFAEILAKNAHFVVRCSSNAFKVVEDFIAREDLEDTIVSLVPSKDHLPKVKQGLLPPEIKIRLVKVELNTGEIEILATSLLDQTKYTTEDFYELYNMRWGIETFYDRLKNNLSLENFTGETPESVKQDFYATILFANLESELTSDADEELMEESSQHKNKKKVNKNISYNVIKEKIFMLLFCNKVDYDEETKALHDIFKMNPTPIRPNRSYPRNTSTRRALNYHTRKKKMVF